MYISIILDESYRTIYESDFIHSENEGLYLIVKLKPSPSLIKYFPSNLNLTQIRQNSLNQTKLGNFQSETISKYIYLKEPKRKRNNSKIQCS